MAETHGLVERLEKAVTRLESLFSDSHRSGGMECDGINGVNGSIAPYVEAFDRLLNGSVAEFLRYSKILEGDVKTHLVFPQMGGDVIDKGWSHFTNSLPI